MDLGNGGSFVNRLERASDHDEPLNIPRDVAADAAADDSKETKSACDDQAECLSGNENAIPGYDNTYDPFPE